MKCIKSKSVLAVFALCSSLTLTACGGAQQASSDVAASSTQESTTKKESARSKPESGVSKREEKAKVEIPENDGTPQSVIDLINADIDSTISDINAKFEDVKAKTGDTYEGYLDNKQALSDWYSYAEDAVSGLTDRIEQQGIAYFKNVADTVDNNDEDALEDAIDAYNDEVYEDAYDKISDSIYEDSYDEAESYYYSGVISDASDSADDYSDWYDESSEAYKLWYRSRSDIYKIWYRSKSDVYGQMSDIRTAFLYKENFDVEKTLGSNS